ncbi:MAG: FecCD family ABC transporter permease [Phycisphaerales bacterium]
MPRRAVLSYVVVALGLIAAIVLRLLVGSGGAWLPDHEVLAAVLELRALRVVMGVVVGGSLGAAGAVLQSLLRNPLAAPDLLGVSAGASLAVVIAGWVSAGSGAALGAAASTAAALTWQGGPALLGAGTALALVYVLAQRRGLLDPIQLVLTGVVVSIMCGAGILLIQHLSGGLALVSSRVLIGELSDDWDWPPVLIFAGVSLAVTIFCARLGHSMDAATLGDDEATSLGVRLGRLRAALFISSGLFTACAVALAGPVGFVGLVAPHLARLSTGMQGGHRALLILSWLIGAAIVVGGDALIKAVHLGAGRLPLGILTAILGGPALLVLLRREARRRS